MKLETEPPENRIAGEIGNRTAGKQGAIGESLEKLENRVRLETEPSENRIAGEIRATSPVKSHRNHVAVNLAG